MYSEYFGILLPQAYILFYRNKSKKPTGKTYIPAVWQDNDIYEATKSICTPLY